MTCSTSAAHRFRRWAATAVSVALCAALLGGCGGSGGSGEDPAVAGVSLPSPGPAATGAAPSEAAVAVPDATGNLPYPVRVRVPRLGIDAELQPLRLGRKKELVPPDYGRAGWYEAGPEPGEIGRAVIAGHVDSKTGPDVFAALSRARPGDRIRVQLRDRSTVTFVVQSVEVHPRDRFPTDRVYGTDGEHADLRLITCTGRYDRERGGYQDNVVVFARLAPGPA